MRSHPLPVLLAVVAVVLCAHAAVRAQESAEAGPPAHIVLTDGSATLDREAQSQPATSGMPIVAGDRVRTDRGRVEVLFPDGSALDIDEFSSVEVVDTTLVRVTEGRLLLTVARASGRTAGERFQIDAPTASAITNGPGEYRLGVLNGSSGVQTEFAVLRGSGELTTERGGMPLRSGERSLAWDNAAPSRPQPFNSARLDAFDRWAVAQRDARLGSTSASAQYLPPELQIYGGTLDRYGAWQNDPSYGSVWYPNTPPGWRPYYDGYWDSVPRYGWTWIGADVWSWPTHHYGRWGYARSRWFWIPDRRWAPAWVSWGAAPGYVGWCPLGYDEQPVFSVSVGIGVGGGWNDGWVVLPRTRFGTRGGYVRDYAVSPRMLPANTPFIVQRTAPIPSRGAASRRIEAMQGPARGFAVPRNRTASDDGRQAPRDLTRGRTAVGSSVPPVQPAHGDLFKGPLPAGESRAYRRQPNGDENRGRPQRDAAPRGVGSGAVQRMPMRSPQLQQPVTRAPQAVRRPEYAGSPRSGGQRSASSRPESRASSGSSSGSSSSRSSGSSGGRHDANARRPR